VAQYVRPGDMKEALDYLKRPDAVVIGGGTRLGWLAESGRREPSSVLVVDLQALDLRDIAVSADGGVSIGATATLADLVRSRDVPSVLREAARREAPSTMRNVSTIGGCVVSADPSSELLAALLAHEARVVTSGLDGRAESALCDHLGRTVGFEGVRHLEGRIVTHVSIRTDGATASARVGRTQADRPIVAVVARTDAPGSALLGLCGVGPVPVVLRVGFDRDALVPQLGSLDPPGDFRGSGEYRRHLALVLARRVLDEVSR
jgi:CO/xanthine dehydrogenase FAD-binding subunit